MQCGGLEPITLPFDDTRAYIYVYALNLLLTSFIYLFVSKMPNVAVKSMLSGVFYTSSTLHQPYSYIMMC